MTLQSVISRVLSWIYISSKYQKDKMEDAELQVTF